jgi:hypothetical protein
LGDGISLTDLDHGVKFDIFGIGVPVNISWIVPGSDDAFLVLDRNGNGNVDNGRELFGNRSPQAASIQPNGFVALAEWDKWQNGGNGDGVIDSRDVIFLHLRLWQDLDHDAVTDPGELISLSSLGVLSIELRYKEGGRADRYGNVLRYRAKVDDGDKKALGRWAYDVTFLVRK